MVIAIRWHYEIGTFDRKRLGREAWFAGTIVMEPDKNSALARQRGFSVPCCDSKNCRAWRQRFVLMQAWHPLRHMPGVPVGSGQRYRSWVQCTIDPGLQASIAWPYLRPVRAAVPHAELSFWRIVVLSLRGENHNYTSVPLNRAVLLLAVPMIFEMIMESLFSGQVNRREPRKRSGSPSVSMLFFSA